MAINDETTPLDEVYYNPDFMNFMETHMTYLRTNHEVRMLEVTKSQTVKYEGDFFGLLHELVVEKKFHWIVLVFNGYVSSADYKGDVEYVLVPDFSQVEILKNLFLTRRK